MGGVGRARRRIGVRQVVGPWLRPVGSLAGLLVAYYAFPLRSDASSGVEITALALTVAGLALLAVMMVREVANIRRGESNRTPQALAMLVVLLVMAFSFTFFMLERTSSHEVAGLHTRTDALYFTLSTMVTVGYGDVHATGQAARALVSALLVFDVVVVAALARALIRKPGE